jgi:SAM-dependent methyltransferase
MDYQDALAKLGVGSAHPGGFAATVEWMTEVPMDNCFSVLDVGCGTGRTAVAIQQRYDCDVTGVDVRGKMIEKARKRANRLGVKAAWAVGDAEALPFQDGTFDVVFSESVNVFVEPSRALSEYFRVLRTGGWYVDVEMLVTRPVDDAWRESVRRVYGARHVPDQSGWKRLYKQAGFSNVRVLVTRPVVPSDMMAMEQKYPDDMQISDDGVFTNTELMEVVMANSQWLEANHSALGYGTFLMRKGVGEA